MRIRAFVLAALLLCAGGMKGASAGIIAVFPDMNSFPTPAITGGNATVFSNLLGSGTNVLISQKAGTVFPITNLSSFYSGLTGVSSSVTPALLTAANLTGVDLLFLDLGFNPVNPYSAAEISAVASFLTGGGNIGVRVEGSGSAAPTTNALLAGLGSTMTIVPPLCCSGLHNASTILPTVLTTGVSDFEIGFVNPLSGGIPAIQDQGSTVVAFERIGTVLTPLPVPTPASLPLFASGLGLMALLGWRRNRRRGNTD